MTLADIEKLDKPMLTAKDIAPFLGANPYSIHCQAQSDPQKLGFPVIVLGRRVRIPKERFIKFIKGDVDEA